MPTERLAHAVEYLREKGFRAFGRHAVVHGLDLAAEWWLGVHTGGFVAAADLAAFSSDTRDYAPTSYLDIYRVLRSLKIDWSRSTFVDYGCGKGRAVIVAAMFPFKRVIGVEIAAFLVAAARENVRRMKHRRAGHVDIVEADATTFELPRDANVFYFYNPFVGRVLAQVVDNLRAHHAAHGQRMSIVYLYDDHFRPLVEGQSWIRCTRRYELRSGLEGGLYETSDLHA